METKICKTCKEEKELTEFYSQKKTRKDGSISIIYHPNCKVCISKKEKENREKNTSKSEDGRNGKTMLNKLAKERIGEVKKNNNGSIMEIVRYEGRHDIYVKFEKGEPIRTCYGNFLKGKVKSPYDRTVFEIGYFGEGKYKAFINNKKRTPQYQAWSGMFGRCYSDNFLEKHPTYKGCSVAPEWHNFQNFAAWYDQNYYEIDNEVMCLDKDILVKGNKIYSPDTCVFVPNRINCLFVKSDAIRGNFPIGVMPYFNKFIASVEKGGNKTSYIGLYNTSLEAFQAYKENKEQIIKSVSEEYKDRIPEKLYKAMIAYKVEITD